MPVEQSAILRDRRFARREFQIPAVKKKILRIVPETLANLAGAVRAGRSRVEALVEFFQALGPVEG